MSAELRRQDILAGDGTRLALFRVGDDGDTPVLLVPGTFSNHTFWLGTRGHGLAWALAEAGFEAVVLDLRGHGASEAREGRDWRFEDWARVDIPAAIDAITDQGSRSCLAVGHSGGGAALLMALAAEPELRTRVAGVVTLASPVPWMQAWGRPGAWAIRATARLLGRFPARRTGLGPEDELPGVMDQWMTWAFRRSWVGDDGLDYETALTEVTTPMLAVAGAADTRFAPAEGCRRLMESTGATDRTWALFDGFDHAGIVVSRGARREVWPRVVEWLQEHDPRALGGLPAS